MKKQILLFSLILICYNDDTVHECLRTEELAKQLCESIKFDGVNNCIYSSDGSCNEGYRECTKYNPSSDFEESKCTSISPSDSKYKCVVEAQGTLKKCVQKLKSCNEYTEGTDCKNLKADEGYRCVLYNGQCKQHKEQCTGLNEDTCNSNIPKDKNKKCVWSSTDSSCVSNTRTCTDFITYEDKYGTSAACLQLSSKVSTKTCYLNGDNCDEYYKDCTVGDSSNCGTIKPLNTDKNGFDSLYECRYSSSCKKELKMCENSEEDEFDEETCQLLQVTSPNKKICLFDESTKKCKELYITCSNINSESESIRQSECANIIPRNSADKEIDIYSECYYDSSEKKCKIKKKDCNELDEEYCNSQVLDNTIKRCLYLNNECKELYKTCDNYNNDNTEGKTQAQCEEIVPLEDPNYSKCYINEEDNNKCTKIKKACSGLSQEYCNNQKLENELKRCLYKENSCIEVYKTCDDYNNDEENEDKSDEDCTNIELADDPYYKCYINTENENKCEKKKKECSDILSSEYCNNHALDNTHKKCLFIDDACIEIYKTCEDFNEDEENTAKNREDCIAIKPEYKKDLHIYQCKFEQNTCSKSKIICGEDYKDDNEEYCESLSVNLDDKDKFKCAIDNDQCKKLYKACNKYDGADKAECNSIKTDNADYICDFNSNNQCIERKKICSDYKTRTECESIKINDNTECVYENSECVEKKIYKDCSEYDGDDDDECESIEPKNQAYKCVFTEGQCKKELKICSDGQDINECQLIIPSDNNKQCIFDNLKSPKCFEQYKTCQLYQDNEQTITQDKCESIIINDYTKNISSVTHKCVYEDGSCIAKLKGCSSFDPTSRITKCKESYAYAASDFTKKCIYDKNNINCSLMGKTCLDMDQLSIATQDICKKADTSSSNRICNLKSDNSGCQEVLKREDFSKIINFSITMLFYLFLLM